MIPLEQVTHCSTVNNMVQSLKSLWWQHMLGDKFADPYDNLPVSSLKNKIPRKGSFKVSNFSRRHHLLYIMMALVTLHVLKSLPDAGG